MTDSSLTRLQLADGSFIISAEVVEALISQADAQSNVPNAFISGLAYTASWGSGPDLSPEQLEHIPVGMQDAAIAPESIVLKAAIQDSAYYEVEETEAYTISKKLQKQSAKNIAFDAAKKRVSRRLLLAERSKKLTVTCPITGIVSLIEIPAIPYPANNPKLAKALVWTSPLADLDNCRGIAQQGASYLRRLDTQVLAGILLVIATHYELFKFQPFDTGAQKNAILRTAGKDYIIDAIIMIESLIHSNNCLYLPKLSLVFDSNLEAFGLEVRMQSYLKILADAIAKPDKEAWDDKKIKPLYPIRPVYVKDVKNAEKKVSFLARQEQARAKKEFAEDKKAGKIALGLLRKQVAITDRMNQLMTGALTEDGILAYPSMILEAMISRLDSFGDNANAKILISFLKKDRRALTFTIEELEESIQDNLVEEEEDENEQDDPAPGNETAILEESGDESSEESGQDTVYSDNTSDGDSGSMSDSITHNVPVELTPPAGLSAWQQLLWKKKMVKATAPRNIVQSALPSVATYTPAAETKEHITITSYVYQANRLYIVGSLSNGKRIHFVTNDFGELVPVRFFSEWDVERFYE